ncbi:exodeoxyribonuclease V subunit gamma [Candidatus Erwinia haradaeae]|uniref:RecBCD enzyme subunit RecC n=1 Tax=Candidatus Erwinia haradaeae TaxID=1922217 RepID=A0A451DA66_9GAMM|nr:exodeoxyribonuclease V subunit gamma [Candidatus Erwinia haradaeae]VFP83225.1 RecBCD enzyme subunit RecC [Candidatus Erwinia haradaeae]
MITLYHSNKLEMLKRLLCREIKEKPLCNPLCPEVVLVKGSNIVPWLKISLAEEFGIAANIDFPSPENFIWDIVHGVFPLSPKKSLFSKSSMRWKMRAILPSLLQDECFVMLRHYLIDDIEDHKLFQLTSCVAILFKEYMVNHPEWLHQWGRLERVEELGDAQTWQAPLWVALVAHIRRLEEPRRGSIDFFLNFLFIFKNFITRPPGLPDRVFIFGLSTLPISYVEAIGMHTDVHIFFTNPCRYYWGDIPDNTCLTQLKNHHRNHYKDGHSIPQFRNIEHVFSAFNTVGEWHLSNPLLSAWGQSERENLFLFVQCATKEICAFVNTEPCNLLQTLQYDILELKDHSMLYLKDNHKTHSYGKRIITLDDHSVAIHVCYSLYHEVEVLYDQLLVMMQADPALTVRDIVVMAADINIYRPFIQAIFSSSVSDRSLPFYIADEKFIEGNSFIKIFHVLLRLPDSQYSAEEVLSLLEYPAVSDCFGINQEDFLLLRRWVSDSGIRWGLDDQNACDSELPITAQNTWKFGLHRMLLGYAIDSAAGEWNGILPFDESSGLNAELVGKLAEFLICLKKWRTRLSTPLNLSGWLPICRQILDDFVSKNADNETELVLIEDQWNKVINHGIQALYHEIIPLSRLRDELNLYIDEQSISHPYLPGFINFCTLIPMICVPFKVVYLLGMNEGVYPRTMLPFSVDLMHNKSLTAHTQKSNNRCLNSEKYIFLDALNSANEKFYISYVNISIHDNTECYPSLLVSELMEYISYSFILAQDLDKDTASSAIAITNHIQHVHRRIPLSKNHLIHPIKSCEVFTLWPPTSKHSNALYSSLGHVVLQDEETSLNVDTLINFWRHPVRYFFQSRLGIFFERDDSVLSDIEPFVVDSIARYQMDSQLLKAIMNQTDPWLLYTAFKAAGMLPYGVWGKLFWEQRVADMGQLSSRIAPHYAPVHNREISLHINRKLLLTGYLTQVQAHGLLRWRPGVLNFQDALTLWLEHLMYCAIGGNGISLALGLKDSVWRFLPLDSDEAKKYLLHYFTGYRLGLCFPIFLTSSGGVWLQECFDKHQCILKHDTNTQRQARRKLLQYWNGTNHMRGEKDDFFMQRLIPNLNSTDIQRMTLEAECWLTPVLQYHQVDSPEQKM